MTGRGPNSKCRKRGSPRIQEQEAQQVLASFLAASLCLYANNIHPIELGDTLPARKARQIGPDSFLQLHTRFPKFFR